MYIYYNQIILQLLTYFGFRKFQNKKHTYYEYFELQNIIADVTV